MLTKNLTKNEAVFLLSALIIGQGTLNFSDIVTYSV